jgi:hypothetical protein
VEQRAGVALGSRNRQVASGTIDDNSTQWADVESLQLPGDYAEWTAPAPGSVPTRYYRIRLSDAD